MNVANGNRIIQATDATIAGRGLSLTYARTYNSQTGWSTRWGWGGGWTDTFNSRMYYDANRNELSVYDSTGARYDYCPNGSGGWQDCTPGSPTMRATLSYDGGCGYLWALPSGILYNFTSPVPTCGYANGALGRVYRIYGHNHNNYIEFQYSWFNGDSSDDANLTQVQALQNDGLSMTMAYARDTSGHAVPTRLTLPSGSVVNYAYDGNWNLTDVCEVGNGSTGIASGPCSSTQPHIAYDGGEEIYSPRWEGSGGADGASVFFDHNDPSTYVGYIGYVNPQPNDGFSSTPIQPDQPSGQQTYREYDVEIGSTTSITDGDGHASTLALDAFGRVTQAQVLVGSQWLVSSIAWGADNNVASAIDPRGNETDYSYDSYGNLVSILAPYSLTNVGTIRPNTRFSYDQYHNLLAACDPVYMTGSSSCSATSGVPHYSYDYTDSQEPNGRLADAYTAQNYHYHITYGPSGEGGDYGLPTDVLGDSISQDDGTARQPHRTATYDSHGNVQTTANGLGTLTYSYDNLNREWESSDTDGAVTCSWYNPDGSVRATQSPAQNVFAGGSCSPLGVPSQYATSMSYDADGNAVSETDSPGGTYAASGTATPPTASATIQHLFDGDDREFETIEPYDASDVYTNPWITRYLYDISNGGSSGTVPFNGMPITAHGGYFKTQQLLPPGSSDLTWVVGDPKIANTQFRDVSALATDALGRTTASYRFVVGHGVTSMTTSYDAAGAIGLPYQHCNALAQCATASFDPGTNLTGVQYSDGSTPNETLTYDADGRTVGDTVTGIGTQTYAYNPDGTLSATQEPPTGSSPAQLVYHYYADGSRRSIDVYSSALSQTSLLDDSYRADGLTRTMTVNNPANAKVGSTSVSYTYTPMGRFTQRTETGPAANAAPVTASYTAGLLTQRSFPGGTMSGFEFDPMGNALGYQVQVPAGAYARSIMYRYTMRGEVAGHYAQGVAVSGAGEWDSLAGAPITGATFDAAGRLTGSGNALRTFDAQNHLVGETYNDSAMTAYQWGGNGHPVRIGSAFGSPPVAGNLQYDSIHWDGDHPLFETNEANQLVSLNVGADMQVTPTDPTWSGMTTYDRAVDGAVAACHNASGANGTGNANPYQRATKFTVLNTSPCTGSSMQSPGSVEWWGSQATNSPASGIGTGQVIGMPSTDGIADGFNIIRGVRAFDPELGMWESPDAYAGAIGDPMSALSYAYAGNNPISNRDPSGLCTSSTTQLYDKNGNPIGSPKTQWEDDNGKWWDSNAICELSNMSNGNKGRGFDGGMFICGPLCGLLGAYLYRNPHAYIELGVAAGGSVSITVTGCGGVVLNGGISVGTPSLSGTVGYIAPSAGYQPFDVPSEFSITGGATAPLGGSGATNKSGTMAGLSLGTPGVNGGLSWGAVLFKGGCKTSG